MKPLSVLYSIPLFFLIGCGSSNEFVSSDRSESKTDPSIVSRAKVGVKSKHEDGIRNGIKGTTTVTIHGGAYLPGRPPSITRYPIAVELTVFQNGAVVARFVSSSAGVFEYELPVGVYSVQMDCGANANVCPAATEVTVSSGQFAEMVFDLPMFAP